MAVALTRWGSEVRNLSRLQIVTNRSERRTNSGNGFGRTMTLLRRGSKLEGVLPNEEAAFPYPHANRSNRGAHRRGPRLRDVNQWQSRGLRIRFLERGILRRQLRIFWRFRHKLGIVGRFELGDLGERLLFRRERVLWFERWRIKQRFGQLRQFGIQHELGQFRFLKWRLSSESRALRHLCGGQYAVRSGVQHGSDSLQHVYGPTLSDPNWGHEGHV
jgi:hypothetical protein